MTEKNSIVRVVAGVVEHEGRILLGQRRRDDVRGGCWEFPGGKIEDGETPQAALVREFMEEFGACIEVQDFLGTGRHQYDQFTIELSGYRARLVTEIVHNPAHEQIAWIRLSELRKYTLTPADEFLRDILLARDKQI
jgi:8-oxo-dGTP diphosphatase